MNFWTICIVAKIRRIQTLAAAVQDVETVKINMTNFISSIFDQSIFRNIARNNREEKNPLIHLNIFFRKQFCFQIGFPFYFYPFN